MLIVVTSQWCLAQRGPGGKLSPELANLPETGTSDVIVQYRTAPKARHYDVVTQLGGTPKADLSFISAAAFHVPARALARLAADGDVVYMSPDRPLQ